MPTFMTEYARSGQKWAGCNIEAESLEEAIAIADRITALERKLQAPRFDNLTVLGDTDAMQAVSKLPTPRWG